MISTYNRPDALAVVLESVRRQTQTPAEVIVADDGSGNETRRVIDGAKKSFPCPLIHVWHEDKGFRKCIIWNKAIVRTSCDYIVQIDGDCVLSSHFIEDHLRFARAGWFTCGSRVLLTRKLTEKVLSAKKFVRISAFSPGVANRINAMRLLTFSRFLRERYGAKKPYISRGCNMGFWKEDLLAVNGYDERICGWGYEDAELEVRLIKYGVRRQVLKFAGVQYHLFHEENDRTNATKNIENLRAVIASPNFWTPGGIVKS